MKTEEIQLAQAMWDSITIPDDQAMTTAQRVKVYKAFADWAEMWGPKMLQHLNYGLYAEENNCTDAFAPQSAVTEENRIRAAMLAREILTLLGEPIFYSATAG